MEPAIVYLAARDFTADLERELNLRGQDILETRGRLVLAGPVSNGITAHPAWAQNAWEEPRWLTIRSISDAATQLKALQRNWHCHGVDYHRRTALINAKLPHVSAKALSYGDSPPSAPLGSWTLWEPDSILASARCSSPFPDGEPGFVEDRRPPSRAYRKLWEVFTLTGRYPQAGDLCVDLGACPGGWTWVLAEHDARVFSLDRATLAPCVEHHPLVNACRGSGFGLDPRDVGRVDWLFSDMICYPDKLWTLIERWLDADAFTNAVCTLKFQGQTDHATAARFAAVPGSRLMHLGVNRHELTWILLRGDERRGL